MRVVPTAHYERGKTKHQKDIDKVLVCPNCREVMRYCHNEYSVQLWVCPADGTKLYVTD